MRAFHPIQQTSTSHNKADLFLTKNSEFELISNVQEHDCKRSLSSLVKSYTSFVSRAATKLKGYGLDDEDLCQEGMIGFIKAVRSFDLTLNLQLSTYAIFYVRSEMLEFTIKNFRLAKIATTHDQRKAFFNLRSKKSNSESLSYNEAVALAERLNIKNPNTLITMDMRLKYADSSFSGSKNADDDPFWENVLFDKNSNVETFHIQQGENKYRSSLLKKALLVLNVNEKFIIEERCFYEEKRTLSDLASEIGVSAERVRQIEKAAINKLKKTINLH